MLLNKNKIFVLLYFITIKSTVKAPSTRKQIGPFRMSFLHKVDVHFALLLFLCCKVDCCYPSSSVIDVKALEYLCF